MDDYEISMMFFQNAGRICFAAATVAFIIAVILFFMFDIRTIFMIRSGLVRQAALLADSNPAKGAAPYSGKGAESWSAKGADPYPGKGADFRPAKGAVPQPEVGFRIVREIILTDTDERIPFEE